LSYRNFNEKITVNSGPPEGLAVPAPLVTPPVDILKLFLTVDSKNI
jgi:hypothetical protein